MKRKILTLITLMFVGILSFAQNFNDIPISWKPIKNGFAYSYNGLYNGEKDFCIFIQKGKFIKKIQKSPAKYVSFPIHPKDAVNMTYSPDSTKIAFTRNNNLFVVDIATGKEKQLTFDGSDVILNGYASWVYYEEIFGRPSNYRAFWWSPDSKKIGFYRFDNSNVPMFPIYSPKGQDGYLRKTRYPKAGEPNPKVKIGIIYIEQGNTVWADFNSNDDQYFGTPFWGKESKEFFVSREPRLQNTLDLYAVTAETGLKKLIYHEAYKTWLDWIQDMKFTSKGIYMARCFETGWQQIYFLSYDGKELKRLTSGANWRINLCYVDEKKGDVYFTAERDSRVRQCLYKVGRNGKIKALTDTTLSVYGVRFSEDGEYFTTLLSNYTTPYQEWIFNTQKPEAEHYLVADMKGKDYHSDNYALPKAIKIKSRDGLDLYGTITYPLNFDSSKKYPVHVYIYGGPDTPMVRDRWIRPTNFNQWWSKMGIIQVVADCRASGHNGRFGLDYIYRHLDEVETQDFVDWARYLKSLPYVNPEKIGVQGFSFGGTMTAMLVMAHSNEYHYGVAGGGVYDWALYDTHYTERFMDTPQNNKDGYEISRVINHVKNYPTRYYMGYQKDSVKIEATEVDTVMLKITHGTGDDNVHFQNTLQLIDALQKEGAKFEFMIYPDAKHGYHGYQEEHFKAANREFWTKYLLSK